MHKRLSTNSSAFTNDNFLSFSCFTVNLENGQTSDLKEAALAVIKHTTKLQFNHMQHEPNYKLLKYRLWFQFRTTEHYRTIELY